jgi:hypothetical protein
MLIHILNLNKVKLNFKLTERNKDIQAQGILFLTFKFLTLEPNIGATVQPSS